MQSPEQEGSDLLRRAVREGYAQIARLGSSCCRPAGGCCGSANRPIGYSPEELDSVPEGANLGLGCGNPVALASLQPGEIVLDLGCGAGIDCFLAASRVGSGGWVIGVDMTPEMVERARANARKSGLCNVEFRLGEIEHLPVADGSVDVVISNCVINLSPDKPQVFREALRVLKPGGRLMVSDIVLTAPLPPALRDSLAAYTGCLAGASLKQDYLACIAAAGFSNVCVVGEGRFALGPEEGDPTIQQFIQTTGVPGVELATLASSVLSITVSARKPG